MCCASLVFGFSLVALRGVVSRSERLALAVALWVPPCPPFSMFQGAGNLHASQGHPCAAVLCIALGVRVYRIPPFPVDRSSMSRMRSFRVSSVLSEVS